VLETGAEDFLDTAQLGRPGAPHLVKTGIHVGAQVVDARIYVGAQIVYTGIYIAQARIIDQDSNQHGQQGGNRGERDR